MTKMEVESLSDAINAAVIRLPGRKFPGIVLQGDSLKMLANEAREVAMLSYGASIPELSHSADHLVELLERYVRLYEQALKMNNEPLPY